MSILQISLPVSLPTTNNLSLSSRSLLSGHIAFPLLPLRTTSSPKQLLPPIRMGGGPRTFPGGVSKWQWKRMQANKAKQLLKARLARERQVYEMRKRAELKAAVAELERPWEAVTDRAPKLFSVSADEQLKVLADRFQRPGGFDMWSDRDGPQLFSPVDGLPSARFFPKGVVHSTKPYGKISEGAEKLSLPGSSSEVEDDVQTNGYKNSGRFGDSLSSKAQVKADRWTENTVDNEKRSSDNGFRNKPCKKFGGKPNVVEKLSLPSSFSDVKYDVKRNGYQNFDRVGNNLGSEPETKANFRARNQMSSSNNKSRNKSYQNLGKNPNVADDEISRNGYKNLNRYRGSLSSEDQIKDNKWMKSSMNRNEKSGSNGKLRNNRVGIFGANAIGAENLSLPKSFPGFEDRVERNGYNESDRAIKPTQNSTNRNERSYSDGKLENKGNRRRFRAEKWNTFGESSG